MERKDINGIIIKDGDNVTHISWNTIVGKEKGIAREYQGDIIIVAPNGKDAYKWNKVAEVEIVK